MGDATGRLGEGNADGAVDWQGRALDALRKGAQSLAEAMQQGDGDGPGDGPGNRAAASRARRAVPIRSGGRCSRSEFSDDYSVKIPGEIDVQRVRRILEELRRRLADPARPQIELDYIERLLKDLIIESAATALRCASPSAVPSAPHIAPGCGYPPPKTASSPRHARWR